MELFPATSPPRVSAAAVRRAIKRARGHHEWCWKVFVRLKSPREGDEELPQDIVHFQGRLVGAVSELEDLSAAVRVAMKHLKARRGRLSPRYFETHLAALGRYDTALADSLAISRAIGDAFAWFFYEHDRPLIQEHLKHDRQATLPVGVGGLGERLFVNSVRSLGGKLMIYHGVTTFLRIGDVSFVNLKTRRVEALGELKTYKASDTEYRIGLHLAAETQAKIPKPDVWLSRSGAAEEPAKPAPEMHPDQKLRLQRQLKRMSSAIKGTDRSVQLPSKGLQAMFHFDALADVIARSRSDRFEWIQAGPAMIVGALRCPGARAFGADLRPSRTDVMPMLDGAREMAVKIALRDRDDNSLCIHMPGAGDALLLAAEAIPLAWWPIADQALHDLLFGEVMLVTVHNDAHLRQAIEARGFAADPSQPGAYRRSASDGRFHTVEHLEYFHRLTQSGFMSIDSVLAMIDGAMAMAEARPERSVRIALTPMISLGRPRDAA